MCCPRKGYVGLARLEVAIEPSSPHRRGRAHPPCATPAGPSRPSFDRASSSWCTIDDAVAREVNVELDAVGAERQSVVERRHRVLGPQPGTTAMGEDERPARAALRKLGQGPHLSRGARCKMQICPPRSPAQPRSANSATTSPPAASRAAASRTRFGSNLIERLRSRAPLFPGIIGFDDTVVPQIVNAMLSRHNFILLGLRGQAKTRILRALVGLLDEAIPVMPGCEIHDDPLAPLCAACRTRVREDGDAYRVAWLDRDARYVEKLATPDVTIADLIGDLDPIKAARAGLQLSDELTMHYGLLPRANRGVFAINELPDLAGKVQVGLFNILQEGDVQIKGYPVRLPLDVMLVFSANPEDYTARGKIITPLKDRIGSEIRTHYPATRQHAMAITAQEAWVTRDTCDDGDPGVRSRSRRGDRLPGAPGSEDRQAFRRQPAPADLAARERRLERRAACAARQRRRSSCRASRTSTRRCRRSPASSSSSTKASCAAPTTSPATSFAPRSATCSAATLPASTSSRSPSGSISAARCRSTTRFPPPSC